MSRQLFDGDGESNRSVSIVLGYILVLAISTVLISGLLLAGGNFVEDNRERVIESELNVIGHHIAGNMEQVDRMVDASHDGDPDTAYINQTFQRTVTGSSYNVEIVDDDPKQVVLTATDPEVTVHVNATLKTDVDEEATATGGTISVYYDTDAEELVIDDA